MKSARQKSSTKKIGLFFKQLDNTITLHQRKLDLLKEQKKKAFYKICLYRVYNYINRPCENPLKQPPLSTG